MRDHSATSLGAANRPYRQSSILDGYKKTQRLHRLSQVIMSEQAPEALQALFKEALEGQDLRLVPGLTLFQRPEAHVLPFAASCRCGVVCVLTLEVAKDKTLQEVKDALPGLVEQLRARARMFYAMPCASHARMMPARKVPSTLPADLPANSSD